MAHEIIAFFMKIVSHDVIIEKDIFDISVAIYIAYDCASPSGFLKYFLVYGLRHLRMLGLVGRIVKKVVLNTIIYQIPN